jgi:hypothetical protein
MTAQTTTKNKTKQYKKNTIYMVYYELNSTIKIYSKSTFDLQCNVVEHDALTTAR